jgi:DNA polymerase-3 subunit delta
LSTTSKETWTGEKKYWADIEHAALVVESKKLYDNELPGWIQQFVLKEEGPSIKNQPPCWQTSSAMTFHASWEKFDKLFVTMPAGQHAITPTLIERNIGISKEYNDFELLNAVVRKDILKANRIALHFSKNTRNYPFIKTLATLAYFFNNLMYYHYLTDKSSEPLPPNWVYLFHRQRKYEMAAGHYNGLKTMRIIRWLREYDAMAKGVGARGAADGDYLRELLFRLMH